jgi:hypothetical protein
VSGCRVEPRHKLRPKDCAVVVVKRSIDKLSRLVMEDASYIRRIIRAIVVPVKSADDILLAELAIRRSGNRAFISDPGNGAFVFEKQPFRNERFRATLTFML